MNSISWGSSATHMKLVTAATMKNKKKKEELVDKGSPGLLPISELACCHFGTFVSIV